ncbi:hypothetical protein QE152_g31165 [Popillia japonica]|uniref:Uncharacterized protein n=1 Tax=Popillia japonica TaxID=7064 RepID=A0AAW1JBC7_POPJA
MVTYGQNPYEDEEKRKEDKILPCQQCKPARALVLRILNQFVTLQVISRQFSKLVVTFLIYAVEDPESIRNIVELLAKN